MNYLFLLALILSSCGIKFTQDAYVADERTSEEATESIVNSDDAYLAHIGTKQGTSVSYCLDTNLEPYRAVIQSTAWATINEWLNYSNVIYTEVDCIATPDYIITKISDPNLARASAYYPSSRKMQAISLNLRDGKLLDGTNLEEGILYGIMIHEWGHTLGYTHEHEDRGIGITGVDNRSIMYYPFADGAHNDSDWDRSRLSVFDKLGSIQRYPNNGFNDPVIGSPEIFSEEEGFGQCPSNTVMIGLSCYGRYCDKKTMYCARPEKALSADSANSRRFSDTDQVEDDYGFVKSIACSGSYCDNLTLTYQKTLQAVSECYWSGEFSEEEGYYHDANSHICSKGKAVSGMSCTGSYCDKLRLRCCSY